MYLAVFVLSSLTVTDLVQQGGQLLQQQKLDQAIAVFSQHLSVKPDDIDALGMLANAQFGLGLHADVVRTLSRTVELEPTEARWYHNLAAVHFQRDRPKQALDVLRKGVKKCKRTPTWYLLLKDCLGQLHLNGSYQELIQLAQLGASYSEDLSAGESDMITVWLAHAFRHTDQKRKAIGILYKLVKRQTAAVGESTSKERQRAVKAANFLLGDLHADLEVWDAAVSYYDEGNRQGWEQMVQEGGEHPMGALQRQIERTDRMGAQFSWQAIRPIVIAGARAQRIQKKRAKPQAKRKLTDIIRLVFVVGLPRSGTKLVESMLAAHPDAVSILHHCSPPPHLPSSPPSLLLSSHHPLTCSLTPTLSHQVGIGEASGMDSVLRILEEEGRERRRGRERDDLQHQLKGLQGVGGGGDKEGEGEDEGAGEGGDEGEGPTAGDILRGLNHTLVAELGEGYLHTIH
jgi:tetratricopeptide (TPR) repeat protein